MSNNLNDPFKDLVLDQEEQTIENAIESGEYKDVGDFEINKKLIEEAASRHIKLNTAKPITLRVNQTDLIKIKVKAKRNNIPYQTLLGAVLHDFADSKKELVIK
jgi:predicted DNA binding CopG/RHH family protein